MEDTGIIISSGALGAVCAVASTWIKSKFGTKLKAPLDSNDRYVTELQCQHYRCAIDKRISDNMELVKKITDAINRIDKKIDETDNKAEDRAYNIHRRLDPIVEKVGSINAKIDVLDNIIKKEISKT